MLVPACVCLHVPAQLQRTFRSAESEPKEEDAATRTRANLKRKMLRFNRIKNRLGAMTAESNTVFSSQAQPVEAMNSVALEE